MPLASLLLAFSCQFPNYGFASGTGAPGGNGGGGENAGAGGSSTGGAGSGGQPSAPAGAGGQSAGEGGAAGGAAGEGGAAGAPFVPQLCADIEFVPDGCTCADDDVHAYLFCLVPAKAREFAALDCSFYGMRLSRVDDPQENDWILTTAGMITMPSYFQYFWIGGSSVGEAGNWRWPDGEQFWQGLADGTPFSGVYVNWRDGAPNDGLNESCVHMDAEGWDDASCADPRPYVCESY